MYTSNSSPLVSALSYLMLVLLSTISHSCFKASAARCHVDDETGLLSFKSGIRSDPSGMLSSWKKGTDCCKWLGVTCDDGHRVTDLFLSGSPNNLTYSLSGTISPFLFKLQYLHGVYFVNLQNLTGPFPNFLLRLPRLSYITIVNSKLSGHIPENINIASQLEILSLDSNRFSGPIPTSIGQLNHLTGLYLGSNLFTGPIPLSIHKLKNLTGLELDNNHLSGTIPDVFSGFSSLYSLNLSHNKLAGRIPGSISSLGTKLIYLDLGHNSLSGPIPDFLGKFHALDTLDLSWNKFSGTVPKTFANLTKIFNLDLSHNFLVDPFPEMHVKGIESLDLSYNNFHLGRIPQWATDSPIIYSLKLAKCGIKIKLDDWKPNQTFFYDYIDLSKNNISGSPVKLLNETDYIVGFYASHNRLKFRFGRMPIAKTLKYLDLSENLVFGKVPKAIAQLDEVNVRNNHLCGRLPVTNFSATSFAGNDCLCGSPLPRCKV